MHYLFLIISFVIISILSFILSYKKSKKEFFVMSKIIPIITIVVFIVRLFCYKSIIVDNKEVFWGLSSSPLSSPFLTVITLIAIWLEYTALLIVLLRPYFNFKFVRNLTKYVAPIIFVLNACLLRPIFIILEGSEGFSVLKAMLPLEIGIGLASCLYYWLKDYKEKSNVKEILLMLLGFLLLNLSTLPAYFVQYMFGNYSTVVNLSSFKVKDFTPTHRLFLYGAILLPIAIYYLLRKKDEQFTRFVLLFINIGVLIGFLVNYDYETIISPWQWPFHLCNTALFITPLVLMFKMKRLFYFTYFINVAGALIAMLMPNYADATSVLSMRVFTFWFNHYFAFFMPILLVSLNQFERPKLKQFIYSMVAFLVYFILALFMNVIFSAHGHDVDYFFLNTNYVADKLGNWAERLFDISAVITINGFDYVFHPLYQICFFAVYIIIGLVVWFVYAEGYRISDANADLMIKLKKIKVDEYALKAALGGRKMSEPMDKDANIKYELIHFTKKYASSKKYAVEDANLEVFGGEIFGFLGPNGAGKSTIIKTTVGIQPLSSGSIHICGYDVATQPVEAKAQIGYVPDHYALYEKLTGREYINYIADIYNVSKEDRDERMKKYVQLFQLEGTFDNMIKTYSHGMKQKITIMAALIHEPKVWILDEPLTGLDPNSIYQVKECMKEHASKGNIVFFSSHIIDIVEKLCQRIAIIKNGKILCVSSIKEIEDSNMNLEQFYLQSIGEEIEDK